MCAPAGTGHEGHMKVVSLPIVSNDRCSSIHNGSLPITETKLCAGGEKDKGVCEVSPCLAIATCFHLLKDCRVHFYW